MAFDTSYVYYDLDLVTRSEFWEQPLHVVEALLQTRRTRIDLMKTLEDVRERMDSICKRLKSEYVSPPPSTLPDATSLLTQDGSKMDFVVASEPTAVNCDCGSNLNVDNCVGDILVAQEEIMSDGNDQLGLKQVADIVAFNMFGEMPQAITVLENGQFIEDEISERDTTCKGDSELTVGDDISGFLDRNEICDNQLVAKKAVKADAHNMFDEMPARQINLLEQYINDFSYYAMLEGDKCIDFVVVLADFDPGGKEPLLTIVDHQAVAVSQRLIGCSRRQIMPDPLNTNLAIDRIISKVHFHAVNLGHLSMDIEEMIGCIIYVCDGLEMQLATVVPQYGPHKAEFGKPTLLPFDRGRTCYVPESLKH